MGDGDDNTHKVVLASMCSVLRAMTTLDLDDSSIFTNTRSQKIDFWARRQGGDSSIFTNTRGKCTL